MKKFAHLYLWLTSIVYVFVCGFYLTKALLTSNEDFVFPKSSAPMAQHVGMIVWIMFPVVAMLALYLAWDRYLRGSIRTSMVFAAIPWLYGLGLAVFLR